MLEMPSSKRIGQLSGYDIRDQNKHYSEGAVSDNKLALSILFFARRFGSYEHERTFQRTLGMDKEKLD